MYSGLTVKLDTFFHLSDPFIKMYVLSIKYLNVMNELFIFMSLGHFIHHGDSPLFAEIAGCLELNPKCHLIVIGSVSADVSVGSPHHSVQSFHCWGSC